MPQAPPRCGPRAGTARSLRRLDPPARGRLRATDAIERGVPRPVDDPERALPDHVRQARSGRCEPAAPPRRRAPPWSGSSPSQPRPPPAAENPTRPRPVRRARRVVGDLGESLEIRPRPKASPAVIRNSISSWISSIRAALRFRTLLGHIRLRARVVRRGRGLAGTRGRSPGHLPSRRYPARGRSVAPKASRGPLSLQSCRGATTRPMRAAQAKPVLRRRSRSLPAGL